MIETCVPDFLKSGTRSEHKAITNIKSSGMYQWVQMEKSPCPAHLALSEWMPHQQNSCCLFPYPASVLEGHHVGEEQADNVSVIRRHRASLRLTLLSGRKSLGETGPPRKIGCKSGARWQLPVEFGGKNESRPGLWVVESCAWAFNS